MIIRNPGRHTSISKINKMLQPFFCNKCIAYEGLYGSMFSRLDIIENPLDQIRHIDFWVFSHRIIQTIIALGFSNKKSRSIERHRASIAKWERKSRYIILLYEKRNTEIVFHDTNKKFAIPRSAGYNVTRVTKKVPLFFTPTMNYIILKTIIDSTIQNYNQTNPTQVITESNVSITSMTAKGIDILIRCPHTHKDIRIHAEVNFMN